MPTIDPGERKALLRDWMTQQSQILKANYKATDKQIIQTFETFGIHMNEKWLHRALYGARGKPVKI
jgi:hypothetical protein